MSVWHFPYRRQWPRYWPCSSVYSPLSLTVLFISFYSLTFSLRCHIWSENAIKTGQFTYLSLPAVAIPFLIAQCIFIPLSKIASYVICAKNTEMPRIFILFRRIINNIDFYEQYFSNFQNIISSYSFCQSITFFVSYSNWTHYTLADDH